MIHIFFRQNDERQIQISDKQLVVFTRLAIQIHASLKQLAGRFHQGMSWESLTFGEIFKKNVGLESFIRFLESF